jgi:predicted PurR-regulated permease PerM
VGDAKYVSRALEVSIRIGLAILLVVACFVIVRPFLPLIVWGAIIAIAVYPRYQKLLLILGGRGVLASALVTVLLLIFLIVPTVLLATTVIDGIQAVAAHLKNGGLIVPPPPASIESWPVIGARLKSAWTLLSTDTTTALRSFAPQIRTLVSWLLSASAGIGMAAVQFACSIVLSGVFLAKAQAASRAVRALTSRICGDNGSEFERVAVSTIRSVTTGILGVALIQTVLAGLGFLVAGLPAAGVWTVIFLIAALLQIGGIVLIPAVIYMFMISTVMKAAIFLGWCVIVAVIDNVLKPLLLGRGVAVPIIVVFLGAIGGFLAMGILGLFVGAIALSVGYKVLLVWLAPTASQEA